MLQVVQVASLMLVAAMWTFSLAHAAELPGKMRLDRDQYLVVQRIYYPGFTIGGLTEPLSILALAVLLALAPADGRRIWIAAALAAVVAAHVVYWLVTHPVNKRWVDLQGSANLAMGKAGTAFFGTGKHDAAGDWKALRGRWERSHVVRAALMTCAMLALGVALTT
jgi:hypothetical protein